MRLTDQWRAIELLKVEDDYQFYMPKKGKWKGKWKGRKVERRKQRGGTSHAAASRFPLFPLFPLFARIPVAPFCEFNGRHYFFRYWIVVVPIMPLNSKGARS